MEMKAADNEFYLEESGQVIARIEFEQTEQNGQSVLEIQHTNVYEGNNGRGLGKQLVNKVVEYAREENKLILPVCSYAKKVLESSDDYKDVLAK
jgi:uncharacterized protein